MNRKITGLIVLSLSIFLIFIVLISTKGVYYNDLVIKKSEYSKIKSKRKEASSSLLKTLKFNNYELIYDEVNNSYYYSMVDNKNKNNPYVKYNGVNSNVKIKVLDKIKNKDIENNKSIKIIAYDKTTYYEYDLHLTTLPIMNITYDSNVEINRDDIEMKMSLFDNRKGAINRKIVSDGIFHLRGRNTSTYPKQGFKVELTQMSYGKHIRDNKISLLGMRQDDDWILYAAYNDQEKIRNVFASNLWYESCATNNSFNIKNGMEYKYVELFMNNEYYGLYALGYPIDSDQLELNTEPSNYDYSFKIQSWSTLETVFDEIDSRTSYELISKKPTEDLAWQQLKDYYSTMLTTNDINSLYEIGDINNIIDFYLFTYFIQCVDNSWGPSIKNAYITFKKQDDKYLALYTPWDLDMTFGNLWAEEKNNTSEYGWQPGMFIEFEFNPIYYLNQLGDKKIGKLIVNRYKELRNNEWSLENINKMLDNYEDDIYNSGAFIRDKERWPDGSYNSEIEKLSKFRKYVEEELSYMDQSISYIWEAE